MKHAFTRQSVLGFAAVAAATLGACARTNDADKSQVVARVNDAEITITQLRTALLSKSDSLATADTAQQALDGLINEQLLVDAAIANKLQRDPTVVQAVESARRQMLARAYLERMVFPKQEIGVAEQAAYYKSHSELFAQRRIYQLTSYSMASDQLTAEIATELGGVTDADGAAAILTAHRVTFDTQNLTRAAEQLPIEEVTHVAAAKVGDVLIMPAQAGRKTVMVLTGSQASPLGFESAQPIIQQYLSNVRNAEALDTHLKQARAAAKITRSDSALLVATASPPSAAPTADDQDSRLQHGAAVLN